MKIILVLFFTLISVAGIAQESDSLAIKEIDSLTLVAYNLIMKGALDSAFVINTVAENISIENIGTESYSYSKCCNNFGTIFYYKSDFLQAKNWWLKCLSIRENILGRNHQKVGELKSNLGTLYQKLSIYDKAEVLQWESLHIMEMNVGKDHPHYAQCLNNLGALYVDMGILEKAKPLFIEALNIFKNNVGESHPLYHKIILSLANIYFDETNYHKAEMLYIETITLMEKYSNTHSIDYIQSLENIGLTYSIIGEFKKAEIFILSSLINQINHTGKVHKDYCHKLLSLSTIYVRLGNYEKAEELLIEALTISKTQLKDTVSMNYVECIFGMGNIYRIYGDYANAESFYLDALKLCNQNIIKNDFSCSWISTNLGILYEEIGEYNKAELLLLEEVARDNEKWGNNHPEYALALCRLAKFYSQMHIFENVEKFYLKGLGILQNSIGSDHEHYAGVLNNLGAHYINIGHFEKAHTLLLQSLSLNEKRLGKMHSEYANSLFNLANLYFHTKKYEDAEPLYQDVITIRAKTLGKEHPSYAEALNNLGNLNRRISKPEIAREYYLEAMAIFEKVLGKKDPNYSDNLINMAAANAELGNVELALQQLNELNELDQMHILNAIYHLSEKELGANIKYYVERQSQILSISHFFQEVAPTDMIYNNVLFHKGFLLNASKGLSHFALSDSVSTKKFQLLKTYNRQLAIHYSKPIIERDSILVDNLELKSNTIEKELARTVVGYSDAIRQLRWQEVQKALNSDEAAIEFVNFHFNFPQLSDSIMYAALLITSESLHPIFIPLFEERELQNKMSKKLTTQHPELVAQMYTRGLVPLGNRNNQEGLYDLLWKSLDSLLNGIKKIYYSPTGMLHQINFNAIPIGYDANDEELILADKYALIRLGSTRSIVIPDATLINTSNEIVLYGGIHYEMDTTLHTVTDSIHDEPIYTSSSFTYALRSVSNRGGDWSYLPGTEREIAEIAGIGESVQFPVSVYQGSNATEESVKEIGREKASPRILHFATHGFFFPDPEQKMATSFDDQSVFKWSDNPMIRSGLILAGGNYAWKNGKPVTPEKEDGILTAYEISQMNLSNTELVVLSACETGLGDIQGNEGVYGLQRAFKIAGAKYLIMSLWQVPDRETMEFMTTFYKNWLDKKMSIPEAFRKTQSEMRERFDDLYSWGAFVLVE